MNEHYKMIAIDLSKQEALDADPQTIQQINFTGNLERNEGETMFFIIEEAKETQGTFKVSRIYFNLIKYQYEMTHYNTLNVKSSDSQLNKLRLGIKNYTEVTFIKVSLKVNGGSNDENSSPHKSLSTNT